MVANRDLLLPARRRMPVPAVAVLGSEKGCTPAAAQGGTGHRDGHCQREWWSILQSSSLLRVNQVTSQSRRCHGASVKVVQLKPRAGPGGASSQPQPQPVRLAGPSPFHEGAGFTALAVTTTGGSETPSHSLITRWQAEAGSVAVPVAWRGPDDSDSD